MYPGCFADKNLKWKDYSYIPGRLNLKLIERETLWPTAVRFKQELDVTKASTFINMMQN